MNKVLVVKDGRFARHLDKISHLESSKRLLPLESALDDASLRGKWEEIPPRHATPDELALIHTRGHIARVTESAGKTLTSFDIDTQATAGSHEAAILAVGGVFALLDSLLAGKFSKGFALVRPPGHHAEADRAMGFCLFNNVALGAAYLRKRHRLKRVMIVDIDAHHGNGIQNAFYDSEEVLYLSFHQFPAFPGSGNFGEVGRNLGEGFTVNVPLAKGTGDLDFARIIHFLVHPLAEAYRPEIILVACGFDLYHGDRLAGFQATPEGYALMVHLLKETAEKVCAGRIAFILEGGYHPAGIRDCGLRAFQELCGISTVTEKSLRKIAEQSPFKLSPLKKALEIHKKYWRNLPYEW